MSHFGVRPRYTPREVCAHFSGGLKSFGGAIMSAHRTQLLGLCAIDRRHAHAQNEWQLKLAACHPANAPAPHCPRPARCSKAQCGVSVPPPAAGSAHPAALARVTQARCSPHRPPPGPAADRPRPRLDHGRDFCRGILKPSTPTSSLATRAAWS